MRARFSPRRRPQIDVCGFIGHWTPRRWSSWPAIRLRRRLTQVIAILAVVALALAVVWIAIGAWRRPTDRVETAPLLVGLRVLPEIADVAGYDRDCGPSEGCVFGPAWSDDVDVAGGYDGCDTRNDILARDLTDVVTRAGTNDCVVLSGVLIDPYSGSRIDFVRGQNPQPVQIDHVFPLAAAWDRGASTWTADRRRDFANDPAELLATVASVNAGKSARTPADWRPPSTDGGCRYARQFVQVAVAYELAVIPADVTALGMLLRGCPT